MGVTTRSVQSERGPRVKLHRNAKTTPPMRALIVQRIRQRAVAARRGGGRSGHQRADHVQVAAAAPTRRAAALEDRVLDAASSAAAHGAGGHRPHPRRSLRAADGVGDCHAAASATFDRRGHAGAGGAESAGAAEPPRRRPRYEWAQPGELVHLDVKPLGAHRGRRASDSWRSRAARAGHRLGIRACRGR